MTIIRLLLTILVAAVVPLCPARASGESPSLMAEAARDLLAALTPEQRAKAALPFESDLRLDWHFIPKTRKGAPLKEMTPAQRHLAHAFMSTGLGRRGYVKATTIMSLEEILAGMERGTGPARDAELYYFTIFGEPADAANWGWSVEGHHLSLNFTVVGGVMVASEPTFLGSNPAEVRDGPRRGLRVLGREEDIARDLLKSLDARQLAAAVIETKAPSDIFTGNRPRIDPLDARGLAAARMNPEQTRLLLALLAEYAGTMPQDLAEARMEKVRAAGLDNVVFAWAGGAERGQGHYYRLQGPTFLVEYDNTQNDANHVHSVWRDFKGDFGADLLAAHYKNAPHQRK